MAFPETRLRRLRENPKVRRLVEEVTLQPRDLVPVVSVENDLGQDTERTLLELLRRGVNTILVRNGTNGFQPHAVASVCALAPDVGVIADLGVGSAPTQDNLRVLLAEGASFFALDTAGGKLSELRENLDSCDAKHVPIIGYSSNYLDPEQSTLGSDLDHGAEIALFPAAIGTLNLVSEARSTHLLPVGVLLGDLEIKLFEEPVKSNPHAATLMLGELLVSVKRAGALFIALPAELVLFFLTESKIARVP